MNKTSSKETSTLSCLQQSLCVPSHRPFQFLPGTCYNSAFLSFFRILSISFPLISHHQSNRLNTFSSSNSRQNDLMGAPSKQASQKGFGKVEPAIRSPSVLHNLQDRVEGDASTGKTYKVNLVRNLPVPLPLTQKAKCSPKSRKINHLKEAIDQKKTESHKLKVT